VSGLWNVRQQAALDHFPEGREWWVSWSAWYSYGALALLSIAGGVILRRRRVPVFPLAVFPVLVVISVTITFATTRYRAIAEGVFVLLAAVAIDAAVSRLQLRRGADAG
jgi:hypothetical protein